jgi:hypothetical protein
MKRNPRNAKREPRNVKRNIPEDSLRRGYEAKDLPLRPFLYVSGGFVLSILGILILLWLLLNFLVFRVFPDRQHGASLVEQVSSFPRPEIQTNPGGDYGTFLQAQNERLNTYGWVDRPRGIVRVPIEEAMKRLLQQGLPVRSPQTGPTEIEMIQQKNEFYPRRPPQ